jgi:hypothetical protein
MVLKEKHYLSLEDTLGNECILETMKLKKQILTLSLLNKLDLKVIKLFIKFSYVKILQLIS